MYLGRVGSGIAMLILHGLSWLTYVILIGWIGFGILAGKSELGPHRS